MPVAIPTSRYVSPEFARLERDRLWPRVWQLACSLDHVANPGDFHEYRVGDLSVLLVRGDDGELRAFQNACRHRGSALCDGTGGGLIEIRCPFHRWTWDLSGRLREVPSRRVFGILNDDVPLIPVQVDTWGPMVFVNLALDAEPLAEFLEEVPDDCAWARLDEMRCLMSVTGPARCNWKTLIDGFSETYHVQGIHREMLPMCDDVNGPQHIWHRHGKLEQSYGLPSPRLRDRPSDQQVWDAFVEIMGVHVGQFRATRCRARARGRRGWHGAVCDRRGRTGTRASERTRLVRDPHRGASARHAAVQPLPEPDRARVLRHGAGRALAPRRDARRRVHGCIRVRALSRRCCDTTVETGRDRGGRGRGPATRSGARPGLQELRAQSSAGCTNRD